jgi:hypothetical protein
VWQAAITSDAGKVCATGRARLDSNSDLAGNPIEPPDA